MNIWIILAVVIVGVVLLGGVAHRLISGEWPWRRTKRQRRWVLNVQREMPLEYLLEVLRLHTPTLSASQYNKLSPELKKLFVPSRKV